MMGLAELNRINRAATRRAQAERRMPALIEPEDVDAYLAGDEDALRIPYIGDRTPRGFRRVGGPLFVDKSGFGAETEPALTLRRFLVDHVKPAGASWWGVVEEGMFQVYVQRFERTGGAR